MYAILNSKITIGTFTFTGVHEVTIKRGMMGIAESAIIKIPAKAKIVKGRRAVPTVLTTDSIINYRDPVEVQLGYNNDFKTEFKGFVKRKLIGMPLEIECEGYCQQLRLDVALNKQYTQTTVKAVLEDMVAGTDITIDCPVDFPLVGLRMVNADGLSVIEHIKKVSENSLNIFFIKPDVLWCGLVYTPYLAGKKVFDLPTVKYRLGWNAHRDNELKQRIPTEKVQVIMNGTQVTGDKVRTESKDKTAKRKETYLMNNVPDSAALKNFANELASKKNYTGYEGFVNALLVPFVEPGYYIELTDKQVPDRNGTYLCTSVETTFGVKGAKRKIGLGVKLM